MPARELAEQYLRNMMTISIHPPQKKMEHFSGGEMFILVYLMNFGDTCPSRFSEVSRTTTAHVSKALKRLEEKGEIRRRADPLDARKKLVSITPEGRLRVKQVRSDILNTFGELMNDLGEADARELVRLTGRIAALVESKHNG